MAEAVRVLHAYGWQLLRVRGSHHMFGRGGSELVIPFKRPHILPIYVRRILAATREDDGGDQST